KSASRAIYLQSMSAPLSPNHDDHDGSAARRVATRAAAWNRLRATAAAWDLDRRRLAALAISNPLHHACNLFIHGPPRTLGTTQTNIVCFRQGFARRVRSVDDESVIRAFAECRMTNNEINSNTESRKSVLIAYLSGFVI